MSDESIFDTGIFIYKPDAVTEIIAFRSYNTFPYCENDNDSDSDDGYYYGGEYLFYKIIIHKDDVDYVETLLADNLEEIFDALNKITSN